MSEIRDDLTRRLNSFDPLVRERAWEELYGQLFRKVYRFFCKNGKDHQQAENLAQTAFFKVQRMLQESPVPIESPEGLHWSAARSVLFDDWRRTRRTPPRLPLDDSVIATPGENPETNPARNLEARIQDELQKQEIIALCQHLNLKTDWERIVALLRWHVGLNYSPAQIALLTGRSVRTLQNDIRRIDRQLAKQKDHAAEYLHQPTPWETALTGVGAEGAPVGVSLLNIVPRIAPECLPHILSDLGVADSRQLFEQYFVALVVGGVDFPEPAIGLYFWPRTKLKQTVIEGEEMVTYRVYTLAFRHEGRQELLYLTHGVDVPSRMVAKRRDERAAWTSWDWWSYDPQMEAIITKKLNPKVFHYVYADPFSREQSTTLFRVQPVEL